MRFTTEAIVALLRKSQKHPADAEVLRLWEEASTDPELKSRAFHLAKAIGARREDELDSLAQAIEDGVRRAAEMREKGELED